MRPSIVFTTCPRADLPVGLRARMTVVVDGETRGLITLGEDPIWTWFVTAPGHTDFRAGHARSEDFARISVEVAAEELADAPSP